jgi:hypothetical protein
MAKDRTDAERKADLNKTKEAMREYHKFPAVQKVADRAMADKGYTK